MKNTEILLTIKLQQELFIDPKRVRLLKEIQQCGSINQAAKNAMPNKPNSIGKILFLSFIILSFIIGLFIFDFYLELPPHGNPYVSTEVVCVVTGTICIFFIFLIEDVVCRNKQV